MCNNIIILWLFIILKIIVILFLPIFIIAKRKKKYVNILIVVDILFLAFFLICNIFTINKCVYNSNLNGIKRTKTENQITLYNELHPEEIYGNLSDGINAEKKYKTSLGKDLYYFNQNKQYMKNAYYTCNGQNIYMNSFGSSITSVSIAISTLYDNNINPVQIFNYYKEDNANLCNIKFDIGSIFSSVMKRYGALSLTNIDSSMIKNELKNGGIIIAEVSANENSKLTCDHDYIIVYNSTNDGKVMIVSPSSLDNPYVCSYSSRAYGNTIDYSKNSTISIDELNKEAVNYYLIKKVS